VVVAAYLKMKPAFTVVVAAFDLIPDASRKNQLEFHLHQELEETTFHLESGCGWKAGLTVTRLTAAGVLLAGGGAGGHATGGG
jgi:hypothetical protein